MNASAILYRLAYPYKNRAKDLLRGSVFSDQGSREEETSLKKYGAISVSKLFSLAILLVLSLLLAFAINKIFLLIFPFALMILSFEVSQKKKRLLLHFEQDFPAFLISLSSSIKCGLDPFAAFLASRDLFSKESPLQQAIVQAEQGMEEGLSEEEVINNFANQVNHPDLSLFKQAYLLSRTQGSSLSSCLQRIARVVRSRQSFRRKVRSAVALQKLSALGIFFAVIAMLVIQVVAARETFIAAWQDDLGFKLLVLAACLVIGGIAWMFRVSRLRQLQ